MGPCACCSSRTPEVGVALVAAVEEWDHLIRQVVADRAAQLAAEVRLQGSRS